MSPVEEAEHFNINLKLFDTFMEMFLNFDVLTCAARRLGRQSCTAEPSPLDRAEPHGSGPS